MCKRKGMGKMEQKKIIYPDAQSSRDTKKPRRGLMRPWR